VADLVHRLPDTDSRREMDDRVHTVEGLDDSALVSHIADPKVHRVVEVGRCAVRVDLWQKSIQDPDTMTPLQKLVRQVRPYEPRPSGDEDALP
jgi:hypothetical protein